MIKAGLQSSKAVSIAVLMLFVAGIAPLPAVMPDRIGLAGASAVQPEEIQVARTAGGVTILWCSNEALLLSNRTLGLQWFGVVNRQRKTISTSYDDYPVGCTFDGKWVVYADTRHARFDRKYTSTDPDWDGGILDLWRYELRTGRRQRFAVVRHAGWNVALAPTKQRIYLGARHNSQIPMPPPRWEAFWSRRDRSPGSVQWFRDSSGVVMLEPVDRKLVIETFGRSGWSKAFPLGIDGEPGGLSTDHAKRVYVTASSDERRGADLYRCGLNVDTLRCERVLRGLVQFKALPNGDGLLIDSSEDCIRRMVFGNVHSTCLVVGTGQLSLGLRDPSPDGRWVVYTRDTWKPRFPGASGLVVDRSEVFVLRLGRQ